VDACSGELDAVDESRRPLVQEELGDNSSSLRRCTFRTAVSASSPGCRRAIERYGRRPAACTADL